MQIQVDHLKAKQILAQAFVDASKLDYKTQSPFASLLNQVITGDHLTYRYVLVTALLAKAVNQKVNPLALQAGGALDGSYDARSLCHKVYVPFERDFLDSGLGGSNEPFLNKPARFTHISSDNAVRGGNDRRTLELLCELLPKITTCAESKAALTDVVFYTLKRGVENRKMMGGATAINSSCKRRLKSAAGSCV